MEHMSKATEMAILKRDENKCALCGGVDNVLIWCMVSPKTVSRNGNIYPWQAACLCTNCRRVVTDFFDYRSFLRSERKEQMRRQRIKEAYNGNEEQISDGGSE